MDSRTTVIIACSSLTDYISATQEKLGTDIPVIYLDRLWHRDPSEMRGHIIEEINHLDPEINTVLVAMGFCGGSWAYVSAPCRIVMPKIDDCVSLLLTTGDNVKSDLKKPGHLYVREKDPARESFKNIFDRLTKDINDETKVRYHNDWKNFYSAITIIDTGINDCRRPEYAAEVRKDADWLEAELDYTKGGTYMLEKLISGRWDDQFIVLEAGQPVMKKEVLI